MQRNPEQQRAAQKVTIIGAILNAILGFLKIVVGLISHSAGLVADGIHSLSDLLTDLLVMLILRFSGKGPDKEHPWGHAHFETVGTAILGSLLIAVAGAMAYDSTLSLINGREILIPEWPALLIAIVSIISKEWIYRYTLKIGKETKSELLIANAWHSRTDAISSIIVLVGIAGSMAGILWLDAIAAIVVAFMVAKIGWDLSWESLKQLVDTSLPQQEIEQYKQLAKSIDGILDVHSFKSRKMGSKSILELHIQVSPEISASEGHLLGDYACRKFMEQGDIGHIIFHIDTYDDEEDNSPHELPLRQEIEPIIENIFRQYIPEIEIYRLTLHYSRESVDLEILLHQADIDQLRQQGKTMPVVIGQIKSELYNTISQPKWLGKVYLGSGIIK